MNAKELLSTISEEDIVKTIVALQEELIVWKTLRAVRRVISNPHPRDSDAVVDILSKKKRRGKRVYAEERRAEVVALLAMRGMKTRDVAVALGRKYQTVHGMLNVMREAGLITRNELGYWELPGPKTGFSGTAHTGKHG